VTHTRKYICIHMSYTYVSFLMCATVLSNITPFSCFLKIFLSVAEIFRNMRSAQARHQSPKTNRAYSFPGRGRIFSSYALCYISFFIDFDYHLLQTCMYFLERDHTSGVMRCPAYMEESLVGN